MKESSLEPHYTCYPRCQKCGRQWHGFPETRPIYVSPGNFKIVECPGSHT